MNQPKFITVDGVAKAAGVHRQVVLRQLARGVLIPDAEIAFGERVHPLFAPEAVVFVLKQRQIEGRQSDRTVRVHPASKSGFPDLPAPAGTSPAPVPVPSAP